MRRLSALIVAPVLPTALAGIPAPWTPLPPLYRFAGPMEAAHVSGAPPLKAWTVLRYILLLAAAASGALAVALLARRGNRRRDAEGVAA